jgi:serine/threonine protein phosphatase PrpC
MAARANELRGGNAYLDSPKGASAKKKAGGGASKSSGGGIKKVRRRLSVVSDNALIEGLESLSTDDGSTSGGSGGFISAYSGVSKKGYAPYNPRKKNQDRLIMAEDEATGALMMSVFDGHGEAGHLVSQQFKDKYAAAVFNSPEYKSGGEGINAALAKHFLTVEADVLKDGSIDTEFSGTTAVATVITMDKTLYCANCGDSRIMLGELDDSGKIVAKEVSIDNKPDDPKEKARIIKSGGRVFAVEYDDGVDGPARVWLKHMDIPGLAMSRSLGDTVAHSAGVISEAEVYTVPLTSKTKTLIIGSDGLWEFISNQEALDLIAKCPRNDPAVAVEILAKESNKRWMREEQVVDDTTIAVAYFNITD